MSTIKFSSNALGSGSVTIASPNTNSDVTLSLPNDSGTLLYANSSGNVGIGTNIPSTPLSINYSNTTLPTVGGGVELGLFNSSISTSAASSIMFSGTDAGGTTRHGASIVWAKTGAWTAGGANYGSALTFYTRQDGADQVERVRIDASGNVGIGTTTPVTVSARLSIKANGDYDAGLAIGSNASAANWARLDFKNTNAASPAILYQDQSGSFTIRTDGTNPITFATTAIERMRVDSSGNVGIGTNSPTGKLQVAGGASVANFYLSGRSDASFEVNVSNIWARNENANFDGARIKFDVSSSNGLMMFHTATGGTLAERARIDSSGNLLVGTTTAVEKLTVNGNVSASNVFVPVTLRAPANFNTTSGTYTKIAELASLAQGTYVIEIYFNGGFNTARTAQYYWEGRQSGIVGITSTGANAVYNAAPAEPFIVNTTFHHRDTGFGTTANTPIYQIDSDNATAAYGNLSLYLLVNFTGVIDNLKVTARRIF